MPLSVVDLYRDILPKTNCRDCGFPTCLAFAGMVVSEKLPLANCPHLDPATLASAQAELDLQHAEGKWTKRDMAADALEWARERAASMALEDLPGRIGGVLMQDVEGSFLELPYFCGAIHIRSGKITTSDGNELNRWEQVFVLNHMAQGGSRRPMGNWKGLEQFPNTISKIKTMKSNVEAPLLERFTDKAADLKKVASEIGGEDCAAEFPTADAAIRFRPLPRLPVMLLFWDADETDDFGAEVKLLFDETVTEHLDIESILFLSERIRQLLCGEEE